MKHRDYSKDFHVPPLFRYDRYGTLLYRLPIYSVVGIFPRKILLIVRTTRQIRDLSLFFGGLISWVESSPGIKDHFLPSLFQVFLVYRSYIRINSGFRSRFVRIPPSSVQNSVMSSLDPMPTSLRFRSSSHHPLTKRKVVVVTSGSPVVEESKTMKLSEDRPKGSIWTVRDVASVSLENFYI